MSENVLYSDIRAEAFDFLAKGEIPKTLIFAGGSAYCMDFYDTLYQKLIPNIDKLLLVENRTNYQNKIMVNSKNRISQLIYSFKNKDNWDVNVEEWNGSRLLFSNYKLSI
jgi:hypothetical protein